jgi:prevent-host-death family protein
MLTVNIHDAKTQLSKLVEQAAQGESFIIAKAGRPMVKVIPLGKVETGAASRLGFMAGEIAIPDDFDQMGSEQIAAIFEGKSA